MKTKWAEIEDKILDIALSHCKGRYQRNLILGVESLSGSTLRGKARNYAGRYKRSRSNLIVRLESDSRICVNEIFGLFGKRVLQIYSNI